ncbi:N-acetyltransferase family protein [Endozoicomonadaceae bacterium StTr2]
MNNKAVITIRNYETSDKQRVFEIHDRARPIELEGSCDPQAFVPLQDDKDDIEDFMASRKFVACEGETITGFAGINGNIVSWLYVDPAHFGKGIGKKLLAVALDQIKDEASTYVLDGNTTAIALYKSFGFKLAASFETDNAGYPCICQKYTLPG